MDLERKEDAFKLPLHILLNSQCNLLYRRNGNPISLSLKEKRFLEIISAVSTSALPLIQPEALLFPSIFWCQASSGSFPGAIPTALYNSSKYNKQLGFAGLDDMLRTRLNEPKPLKPPSMSNQPPRFSLAASILRSNCNQFEFIVGNNQG